MKNAAGGQLLDVKRKNGEAARDGRSALRLSKDGAMGDHGGRSKSARESGCGKRAGLERCQTVRFCAKA